MDIKIFVATHKNYWMPEDDIYTPIHVGRKGKKDIGYIGDDTADNISDRNDGYCELTGFYWIWKNVKADYLGLVHYRRYFTHKGLFCRSIDKKRRDILSRKDWESLLKYTDIVVADKRKYRIETNEEHYLHAHPREQFDVCKAIIQEQCPEYMNGWNVMMNRTWAHMFNMFVMKKEYYDEFCQWWFDVMFEVEKKVDLEKYAKEEQRWFIDGLLLDVWLETKKYKYKEINVDFFENQNWLKKLFYFFKRKITKI